MTEIKEYRTIAVAGVIDELIERDVEFSYSAGSIYFETNDADLLEDIRQEGIQIHEL
jgi:rRNA-processing protein FCF1